MHLAPEQSVVYTPCMQHPPHACAAGSAGQAACNTACGSPGWLQCTLWQVGGQVDSAVDSLFECLGIDSELQRAYHGALPAQHSMGATRNSRCSELSRSDQPGYYGADLHVSSSSQYCNTQQHACSLGCRRHLLEGRTTVHALDRVLWPVACARLASFGNGTVTKGSSRDNLHLNVLVQFAWPEHQGCWS